MKKFLLVSLVWICLLAALPAGPAQGADSVKYGRYPNSISSQFVTDGSDFYYIMHPVNITNTDDLPYTIVKQSADGSSKTTLYTASGSLDDTLNLMDGWLYFSEGLDGKVYRIRTDGAGLTLLYTARQAGSKAFSVSVHDLLAVEDKLYILCWDPGKEQFPRLVSLNLNGSNPQVIYNAQEIDCYDITAYGRQLFMLQGNSVVRYDIRDNSVKIFSWGTVRRSLNTLLQADSWGRLYFYSPPAAFGGAAAYSFKSDGSDLRSESPIYSRYIIVEDMIYYYGQEGNIYRAALSNSDSSVKITDSRAGKFFAYHQGYLYTYDFADDGSGEKQTVKIHRVNSSESMGQASSEKKALPLSSAVLVNGASAVFDAYTIEGSNYFKLRDIAQALRDSEKPFEVAWDGENHVVNLISGKPYTTVGGEMKKGDGVSRNARANTSAIHLNGEPAAFTAYTINGNNYVKLRDLAKKFNFKVAWDGSRQEIIIDTSKGYTEY